MNTQPEMAVAVVFTFVAILVGVVLGVLLTVLPFWMICKKAGFAPALALLMLIPGANIILPFYLAFAEWPALRQRACQTP